MKSRLPGAWFIFSTHVQRNRGLTNDQVVPLQSIEISVVDYRVNLKCVDSPLKDAEHPFYSKVYKEASKINHEFANQMDACIIR